MSPTNSRTTKTGIACWRRLAREVTGGTRLGLAMRADNSQAVVSWNPLPATLIHSGGPPPDSGRVGLVIAYLGSTSVVRVNDFVVTILD